MAAPRSSWKGYLRVSLVSCPVRLYPASSGADRIAFHNLAPGSMSRITMVPTDPTTGKAVSRDQLQKGYEFEKGRYVVIADEELEKIQIESNRVIDVTQFVADAEIDPLYLDAPYWLAPDGKMANETFRVLVEAMRREGKAGIGRLVLSSRERPVLLSPRGKGIMIRTLRAPEEVRREEPYFEDIEEGKLDEGAITLARQIVDQKTAAFDPKEFTDRYQVALAELIKAKIKGEKIVTAEVSTPAPVVDLMAALKQSLETIKPPASSKPTRARGAAPGKPESKPEPKKAVAAKRKGTSRRAG
ncbi:MAG TPA: Ku protein [Candidatus Sulfotelmatobacter sp.]|nr:Ku protein [Candidatus Sulfotelmatobacter sp.]